MKDGRTHLAHKAEHAVDVETGALLAVTIQGADLGDTNPLAIDPEVGLSQLHRSVAGAAVGADPAA